MNIQEKKLTIRQAEILAESTASAVLLGRDEDTEQFTIPGIDIPIKPRCFNATEGNKDSMRNTKSWYTEDNNIILILNNGDNFVCTSVERLKSNIANESQVLYRCNPPEICDIVYTFDESTGHSDLRTVYNKEFLEKKEPSTVKGVTQPIPYHLEGSAVDRTMEYIFFTYGVDERGSIMGYIPKPQVDRMIIETLSGDSSRVFKINFVTSFPFTYSKIGSWHFGGNHCQSGSTILVYNVEFTN